MNTIEKDWEIKDRTYLLANGMTPLTYKIKSTGLLWFDEESGTNREMRYCVNQNSIFVDEQDEFARLGHIIFEDGALFVPRNQQSLQKLLSLYHPQAGTTWRELDEQKKAGSYVDYMEYQLDALNLVSEMDIEHLEAILRTELGSDVSKMSSKELKRDGFRFAQTRPRLFMELANDDDIKLRNLANRAVEAKILKLTDNNTTFKFANGKKVMTVPFDQHPYAALAQYFKTDEGIDLMKSISKKLS